MMSIIIGGMSP